MDSVRRVFSEVIFLLLIAIVVLDLFPFVWIFLTSIKTYKDLFSIPIIWFPNQPNLGFYWEVLVGPFMNYFKNTVVVSLGSTFLSMAIGTLAAYGFSRFKSRLSDGLLVVVLVTRMFPTIALIVPVFLVMKAFQLLDTYAALVIVYTAYTLPFVIWMMQAFFGDVPREVEEAALIDGSSRIGVFWWIALRLAGPGLAATTILDLIYPWNEFPFAVVLTQTAASKTAPVGIAEMVSSYAIAWGPMSAASILFTLPILAFSIFAQRFLVRGLTLGAVKG
jgi:multiple sugar transport system permease protein